VSGLKLWLSTPVRCCLRDGEMMKQHKIKIALLMLGQWCRRSCFQSVKVNLLLNIGLVRMTSDAGLLTLWKRIKCLSLNMNVTAFHRHLHHDTENAKSVGCIFLA
jgi:hypothetical protein